MFKIIVAGFLALGVFFLLVGLMPYIQSTIGIQIINPNLIDIKGAILLGVMFCIGAIVSKKLYLAPIYE